MLTSGKRALNYEVDLCLRIHRLLLDAEGSLSPRINLDIVLDDLRLNLGLDDLRLDYLEHLDGLGRFLVDLDGVGGLQFNFYGDVINCKKDLRWKHKFKPRRAIHPHQDINGYIITDINYNYIKQS